jgi:outer membrane protein insertion porin family
MPLSSARPVRQNLGPAAAALFGLSLLITSGCETMTVRGQSPELVAPERSPFENVLTDVLIEGNRRVSTDQIRSRLLIRKGEAFTEAEIRDDIRSLYATGWFSKVEPRYRLSRDGMSLVLKVTEQDRLATRARAQSPAPLTRIDPIETAVREPERSPVGDVLIDVRVEGNATIESGAVLAVVRSQIGRPVDETQIKEDLRALYATRWFYSVERRYRVADDGLILIFRVVERPIVRKVEFRGNRRTRTSHLLKQINIEEGSPFDVSSNKAAARKIERFYQDKKSYPKAKVRLLSGADPDDRDVIFEIAEGPRVVVSAIDFEGNDSFRSSLLKTKVRTKTALLGGLTLFGGKYDESTIPDDIAALKQYYQSLGYFDVQITKDVKIIDNNLHILPENRLLHRVDAKARYKYTIDEGPQYRVRNVEVVGNQKFAASELIGNFRLKPEDNFNARYLNTDVEAIREKYGELGHLFAQIDAVPKFIEDQPGIVDVVVRIDEDKPYTIRKVNVHIDAPGGNPHTRETVVLNPLLLAPGDPANPRLIDISRTRLGGGQLFERGGGGAPRIDISRVVEEEAVQRRIARGQNPLDAQPTPYNPLLDNGNLGDPYGGPKSPFAEAIERSGQADLDIFVTEAQTGRLMFGVGVNSDAGLVGSFVLEENNFDITRPPTSWRDFVDGTAFRGNGERFRIEAVPGEFVSRYLASWQTPYFLDTDYSLGVSGFFYNRYLPGWDEERIGGRISIGKQITKWLSFTTAFRLESIELRNFATNTPLSLITESQGTNFLSTVRTSLAHDTRDSAFLPSEGHFAEASFEQAFGDFIYPRFEVQGSQHFTVFQRPDGGGRHIVSVHGQANWTDSGTPLFERYFAGGYQSFRGFAFRGVSPRAGGIRVGGDAMLLGSAEYSLPVTADENIRVVAFMDSGTVEDTEDTINADRIRLTVGAGLRLTIPAMGPAPLAFDFGIPVLSEGFDDERIFSFYVGISR